MPTEIGRIEKIETQWAWVKTQRKSACASCSKKDYCHSIDGGDRMLVKVQNRVQAQAGDEVELFINSKTQLKGLFILYMLPVFGLLLGALTAEGLSASFDINAGVAMVVFISVGLVLAFAVMRRLANRLEMKGDLNPVITRIIHRGFANASKGK